MDLRATALRTARSLFPGIAVAGIVAAAASYLGEHYGAPVLLFALLLGMALQFLHADRTSCAEGIEFTAKRLLRVGVALLGLQITVSEVGALGFETLVLVCLGTVLTVGFGVVAARVFGRDAHLGLLTGGAVGICGASAAIAIFSVLSDKRVRQVDLAFTVASVTTLSTIAMILYPLLVTAAGLDDRESGILFGATIHDVAQVVGAGYAVSDEAGGVATTVKLVRVAMLLPVVVAIAFLTRTGNPEKLKRLTPIPGFAIGFAVLVAVNSLDVLPAPLHESLVLASRWFLVMAIAALGMMTSLKAVADLGFRHLAIVVVETLWLLGIILGSLALLRSI